MSTQFIALFSGQGAQKVGMGQGLAAASPAAAQLLSQADQIVGFDLLHTMLEGPQEELTRTSRCQPALYTHGLACLAALREARPDLSPAAAAGLSLGEFTAHAAAGTFDFATGLSLVHQRGQFMEQACLENGGTMLALIGGTEEAVRALAAQVDADIANLNAPGQIVLSGTADAIRQAADLAPDHGIRRAIPLDVAGAYHSRLMAPAQHKLAAALESLQPSPPTIPVWANFTAATVAAPDEIRDTLTRQVTGTVRWAEIIAALLAQGHRTFIEFGPDRTLAGLVGKQDRSATVLSIDGPASLQTALDALDTPQP